MNDHPCLICGEWHDESICPEKKLTRARRCVVVAHPDDESIFCGGLISRHPEDDWTVICCTVPLCNLFPWQEIERAEKFYEACVSLGAKPIVLAFQEAHLDQALWNLIPYLGAYDHFITHGAAGEYGHKMHVRVHKFMSQFPIEKLTFFGYRPNGGRGQHIIDLTEQEQQNKLFAIKRYNHRALPYWQTILNGFRSWPGFRLEQESYDGAWPW